MGKRTLIRDVRSVPIAELEENDDEIIICDLRGCPLGKYSKRDDMTTYMNCAPISSGNTLAMLIPRPS
jgi:hypothetical protein